MHSKAMLILAMFLLVGGFFVVLHFAAGTESLLAPGFDLSWRLVDSGHVERHGLTRKTSKFRIYERPRVILLPGETLEVRIVKQGEEAGQGVGYLDDGTMVVIEEAAGLVGSSVEVEVSTALRTAVGRLLFAKLVA